MNTDTLEPDVATLPDSPQREELFPEEEGGVNPLFETLKGINWV